MTASKLSLKMDKENNFFTLFRVYSLEKLPKMKKHFQDFHETG